MVSAQWPSTSNQWGSIHALVSMASLLSVLIARQLIGSITWEIRQWLAQHARHPVISISGWLSVKLFTVAINQWGITVWSLSWAGMSTPNQSNCFLMNSHEQIIWQKPAKHQAWPWNQRATWSRNATSTSKKGKDKTGCWPWRVWPTTWQTNSTYQSGDS